MADTRQTALIDHMASAGVSETPAKPGLLARAKLGLRRAVVATSVPPLTSFYSAIYKLHVSAAVRALKSVPSVRAIYVSRGIASGEIVPGVSDVDLMVFGDCTPEEQKEVTKRLFILTQVSPLYDRGLPGSQSSLDSARNMFTTDYNMQYRYDQARKHARLVYGEDVLASFPPVEAEKIAGGYYMEARLWWMLFLKTAFGSGAMALDHLFRNSVCYKAVAEIVNLEHAAKGEPLLPSRKDAIVRATQSATADDRQLLDRFVASLRRRFTTYEGDVVNDATKLLTGHLESVHACLPDAQPFTDSAMPVYMDAEPQEVYFAPNTRSTVDLLVGQAKRDWAGFRAAYLVPGMCSFHPDDLILLLEVYPDRLPDASQIRSLCAVHRASAKTNPQRIALYLLLPEGAYRLEIASEQEHWLALISPATNPDVFALLSRPEFTMAGSPRSQLPPHWSRFIADLVEEESNIRKSFANASGGAMPQQVTSLAIVRGIWRSIQLGIIQDSAATGSVYIPLTIPAIRRAAERSGVAAPELFAQFEAAYIALLNGQQIDVQPLLANCSALFQENPT